MLKKRVITAVILTLLASLALFKATAELWQWVILGVGFIAAWEWAGFARLNQAWQKLLFALFTTIIGFIGIELLSVTNIVLLTLLESLLLIYVVIGYQRSQGQVGPGSVGFVLFAGVLSIVLFTTVMVRFRMEFSSEILLMSLFVIWAIDTGAYFSGKRFGKTKLAVHVSPGKTWEGVWGGVLLAFVIALSGLWLVSAPLTVSMVIFAAILAGIAMFSVLGDLFESVLKRQVNLKDSGRILPGHGGMLDRIDSLLIAVPLLYLAWHFGSVI
ncbi:MAG: phosphatidate cytidylyltransferase [Pseudomonadota bacterium]